VVQKGVVVHCAAETSGKFRALGNFRCIMVPRIFPEAGILPSKVKVPRLDDPIEVQMRLMGSMRLNDAI
jgi:hypothetical protein